MNFKVVALLVFFYLWTFSCSNTKRVVPEVKAVSAMKKVMMGQDLSPHVYWDTLPKTHLYAVAPLGRIEGEITVIDGTMYVSTVDENNRVTLSNNWNIKSPFVVYANISEWVSFDIDVNLNNEDDLQQLIEQVARKNGYDLNQAFAFRVLADFQKVNYHIISKPLDELEHNHELHNKAKKHFHLENVQGELLGFYSQHHEGVFTHKGHFIHTHFLDDLKQNMGHVESIVVHGKVKILLPKKL